MSDYHVWPQETRLASSVRYSLPHKVKGAGGAEAIDQDIRDQLLKDCDQVLGEVGGTVHQIIISGDVAFSGQPDEYATAREWLGKLEQKVKCAPDAIRMVCGNHDIDRGVAKNSQGIRDIQAKLRSEDLDKLNDYIKGIVECPFGGPAAYSPLANYNRFAESPYRSNLRRKLQQGKSGTAHETDGGSGQAGSHVRSRSVPGRPRELLVGRCFTTKR